MADVERDHRAGTAFQQHLGEPAGGGPDIHRETTGDGHVERVQGSDQLVRGTADVVVGGGHLEQVGVGDPDGWLHGRFTIHGDQPVGDQPGGVGA